METTVTEHDGRGLARRESDRVFEVSFDAIEPTDVTFRFLREDNQVGSIYNDDDSNRTMARLTKGCDGKDSICVEVPKAFVAQVLDFEIKADRVTD